MTDVATPGRHRRRPSGEAPPLPREFDRGALTWLLLFVGWSLLWIWVFLSDRPAIWFTRRDLEVMGPIVDHRSDTITPVMQAVNEIGTQWATPVLGWCVLLGALGARRIRHALVIVLCLVVVGGLVSVVGVEINRPRPLGVERIGDWDGFAQPSRPMAMLATVVVAGAAALVPQRHRRAAHVAGALVLVLFGVAQVYTGVEHPTDGMAGATVGVAITLTLFRLIVPEAAFPIAYRRGTSAHLTITPERAAAIRLGFDRQLDIDVVGIVPVGLQSSAGSTPLRIDAADGSRYFAKLYAHTHLRADRSYKLGRALLYGRLEDEQRFTTLRRLVQHEDYMLHVMRRVGVPCPEPLGIVELTPDREYLLVTEFLHGAVEISETRLDDQVIDDALECVAAMWHAGLAHRDVKPANIMVQDGRVRLVDVSFAQVRPTPWRQAVDLANMMLVLALGSTPDGVYERARRRFSDEEIAEAFAATRGVTIPSQLRRLLHDDGRDLPARFRELAPGRPPIAIQRWTLRRLGLMMWVLLVTIAITGVFVSNLADVGLR